MTLRITNTLTGQREEFRPIDPAGRVVTWYACGPTVYGPIHIGNARTFVLTDVMRRWMEHIGYEVRFISNITDVDDKIIKRAIEDNSTSEAVAEKFTKLFFEHIEALGVRRGTEHPLATPNIGGMIRLIEDLIAKGHAYASEDGSVWFHVRSFPQYGKLSKRNLDDLKEGERVSADQQRLKRDPMDFALWKASKPGEPAWDSPWGKGRPGWHIECSCMAMACHHSPTIDIHSGGVDLIFPHHENEIAQSEAATGKPFANYWIHLAMLNIAGDKMSKSLGNMKYIDQLLAEYDPLTLRQFLISAHYRTELDFTRDNLHHAVKAARRYAEAEREARNLLGHDPDPDAWRENEALEHMYNQFRDAMNDDFNTARALAAMFEVVGTLNSARAAAERDPYVVEEVEQPLSLLSLMRSLLGVSRDMERQTESRMGDLSARLMDLLIAIRADARKQKQFAIADQIRNGLGELGITLEDKPNGTVWKMAEPEWRNEDHP
jgi:cysteinyl-tRNA synthetase